MLHVTSTETDHATFSLPGPGNPARGRLRLSVGFRRQRRQRIGAGAHARASSCDHRGRARDEEPDVARAGRLQGPARSQLGGPGRARDRRLRPVKLVADACCAGGDDDLGCARGGGQPWQRGDLQAAATRRRGAGTAETAPASAGSLRSTASSTSTSHPLTLTDVVVKAAPGVNGATGRAGARGVPGLPGVAPAGRGRLPPRLPRHAAQRALQAARRAWRSSRRGRQRQQLLPALECRLQDQPAADEAPRVVAGAERPARPAGDGGFGGWGETRSPATPAGMPRHRRRRGPAVRRFS